MDRLLHGSIESESRYLSLKMLWTVRQGCIEPKDEMRPTTVDGRLDHTCPFFTSP